MKLKLLALPWTDARSPQPALGILAAYVRRHAPGWQVETDYAYLDVAALDTELYSAIAASDIEGERLYATLLYPDGEKRLVEYWERLTRRTQLGEHLAFLQRRGHRIAAIVSRLRAQLGEHLDTLVTRNDWRDCAVGLTTSFSQLFANLLFAKRLKESGADAPVVLGGSTVSPATIADSILNTYPFVDFIVRGEGEQPLVALLQQLERREVAQAIPGVATRVHPARGGRMWQVADLDSLPVPDFDAFYARVPSVGQAVLPIEGSRGCWWDRTTKQPKATCNFCNLNVQWDGFRQKSATRIASEMRELSARHRATHFTFLDNIVRLRGFDEFVDALRALDLDARIFHEARANLRPYDLLRFREAGLRAVQFGLEGLSNSFLKRINKGTSVIMNLEVMKTCAELGIRSHSNLIIDFPGSTQDEVDDTLRIIDRYACAYEPPAIAGFELGIDSVVARYPEQFGIAGLRNHDRYADVIPADTLAGLKLYQLSFDAQFPQVNWWPVVERVEEWKADYKPHPLWYQDGGSFLHVFRHRPGRPTQTTELLGTAAKLYHFCLQIRTRSEIELSFGGRGENVFELLQPMIAQSILYQEGDRFLALATAPDPMIAARRIRQQSAPRVRHLSVL